MRVNIYIRKEDEEKWAKIKNKPAWLHETIQDNFDLIPDTVMGTKEQLEVYSNLKGGTPTVNGIPLNTPRGRKEERKFCKHGAAIGMCKFNCTK